jgi:hypothetical protein
MTQVPKGALRFIDPSHKACAFADSEGKDKMDMVVYSGGIIEDHWWWDNLALDLQGVKFKKNKFPVLEEHMGSKKIGFSKKPIVSNNITLDPETTVFVDTPESQQFRKLSKEGFPYQSSLYGVPTKIQRIGEKETAEVNGFTLKGPGTIWREWEYQEASVCVFGYDSNTKASAFSKEDMVEIDLEEGGEVVKSLKLNKEVNNLEGGETTMDLKELKEKHLDLFNQVFEDGKKSAETAFSKEREEFTATISSLNEKFSQNEDRMGKMEKELTLSREANILAQADKLFADKFAESDIEPRLEPKVRNSINHNKYVKNDALDVEAFTKAVDEELKDWQERMPSSGVLGLSNMDEEEEEDTSADDKKLANDLLSRVGQTKTT